MSRTIKIILWAVIGVVAFAGVGIALWTLFHSTASLQPSAPSAALPATYPKFSTSTLPHEATLGIGTPSGVVTLKNFYLTALQTDSLRDALVARTNAYDVEYIAGSQEFIIAIMKLPFADSRAQAEAALPGILGISAADTCKLSVVIRVPASVDDSLAGQDFPLSFCGGGI